VDVDTSHFTGNQPQAISIDGCYCPNGDLTEGTEWHRNLTTVSLEQDSAHLFDVTDTNAYSHIRLNIYPIGASLACMDMPSRRYCSTLVG
jgi:allantoicase